MVTAVPLGPVDMQEAGPADEAWGPQFVDASPSMAGPRAVLVLSVARDEHVAAAWVATPDALPQEPLELPRY